MALSMLMGMNFYRWLHMIRKEDLEAVPAGLFVLFVSLLEGVTKEVDNLVLPLAGNVMWTFLSSKVYYKV